MCFVTVRSEGVVCGDAASNLLRLDSSNPTCTHSSSNFPAIPSPLPPCTSFFSSTQTLSHALTILSGHHLFLTIFLVPMHSNSPTCTHSSPSNFPLISKPLPHYFSRPHALKLTHMHSLFSHQLSSLNNLSLSHAFRPSHMHSLTFHHLSSHPITSPSLPLTSSCLNLPLISPNLSPSP